MSTPTAAEVGPSLFDDLPSLFDELDSVQVSDGDTEEARTLDEKFRRHVREHPEFYAEFRQIALDLHRRGQKRAGAKFIAEIIRYQRIMRRAEGDFKINNSLLSRYARLLMAREPALEGFFELRTLRS